MFDVFAPAKINLFLHVTGRREDGYHTLQSLMTFADVGDVLSFAPAAALSLAVEGPFSAGLGATEGNLVYKAAEKLAAAYGVPAHAAITLTKNLPVASGIGGGSSDAAAALKGLVRLWGLPEEPRKLHTLAAELGADVPACLAAQSVFAEGVGDVLTPATIPVLHVLLVNPGVATPTAAVFKHMQAFSAPEARQAAYTLDDITCRRNDLSVPAMAVTPEITDVLTALGETVGCHLARLSGSGATCFGVYADATAAERARQDIMAQYPLWWAMTARLGG